MIEKATLEALINDDDFVPSCEISKALCELADKATGPFRSRQVIGALFDLALQVEDSAHEYDLLIGEGGSSASIVPLYQRQIDNARSRSGLSDVRATVVDDENIELLTAVDVPPGQGRTLLVTELVQIGEHMQRLYEATSQHRPADTIDVATAGTLAETVERFPWIAAGSAYLAVPSGVSRDYLHRRSYEQWEERPSDEEMARNHDLISTCFQDLLLRDN